MVERGNLAPQHAHRGQRRFLAGVAGNLQGQARAGPQRDVSFEQGAADRQIDERHRRPVPETRQADPRQIHGSKPDVRAAVVRGRRFGWSDRRRAGPFELSKRKRLNDDRGNLEPASAKRVGEGSHDLRIEVGAGALDDDVLRLERRHRLAIRAIARQRIVDVGHRDDARFDRDLRRRASGDSPVPSNLSWCASTIGMTRRSEPPTGSSILTPFGTCCCICSYSSLVSRAAL